MNSPTGSEPATIAVATICNVDSLTDEQGQRHVILHIGITGATVTCALPAQNAKQFSKALQAAASGLALA